MFFDAAAAVASAAIDSGIWDYTSTCNRCNIYNVVLRKMTTSFYNFYALLLYIYVFSLFIHYIHNIYIRQFKPHLVSQSDMHEACTAHTDTDTRHTHSHKH